MRLPEGHDEALLDRDSLNYIAPLGQMLVALARPIHEVMQAYRDGGGLPFEAYGADLYEGQAGFTRPLYLNLLGQEWLPAATAINDRLLADPPARVADLACGGGISSIAIARAYPKVHVDGIDFDPPSIELAKRHLAENPDVAGRVEFHCRDAADPGLAGRYDLVTIFEALHDMSYPVKALEAARGLLAEGGSVLVVRRADGRSPRGTRRRVRAVPLRRQHPPLPARRHGRRGGGGHRHRHAGRDRPALCEEAGFGGFEVLPIEHDFYRFYRLTP